MAAAPPSVKCVGLGVVVVAAGAADSTVWATKRTCAPPMMETRGTLVRVGVGRAPAVSMPAGGGDGVAAVWSDGFCWNNPDTNRAAQPRVCDLVPVPTPGVLNYATARAGGRVRRRLKAGPKGCSHER